MTIESVEARLRRLAEEATPGPWVRGWWSAQVESKCNCAHKGALLGKRLQAEYPGAGPFHVHESDFFPDEHRISGQPPECAQVAGNYDYEAGGIVDEANAAYIAALSPSVVLRLAAIVEAARVFILTGDRKYEKDIAVALNELDQLNAT